MNQVSIKECIFRISNTIKISITSPLFSISWDTLIRFCRSNKLHDAIQNSVITHGFRRKSKYKYKVIHALLSIFKQLTKFTVIIVNILISYFDNI